MRILYICILIFLHLLATGAAVHMRWAAAAGLADALPVARRCVGLHDWRLHYHRHVPSQVPAGCVPLRTPLPCARRRPQLTLPLHRKRCSFRLIRTVVRQTATLHTIPVGGHTSQPDSLMLSATNVACCAAAGLKVPRYDRLQVSMKSLTDNISLWNWRELLVRLPLCTR